MLAASVFSLPQPAIEQASAQGKSGWLAASAGLVLGAAGLLLMEQWAGRLLAGGKGHSGRVIFAIALHNLPQGMAVGLTGALALTGDPNTVAGAVALSLGIGLQNIPEGVAVAFPVRQAGASKAKAFAVGTASGLVEPLGAALGGALAGSLLGDALAAEPGGGHHGVRDRAGADPRRRRTARPASFVWCWGSPL